MAPLNDSARGIAEDFMPMAKALARRFSIRVRMSQQFDEFESAAYEGLCEAAATFDPDHGVKFPTFARKRIFGEMSDLARWLRGRAKHRESIAVEFDEPDDRPADAVGPTREELIEEAVAFIRTLPAQLKPLARLLLIDGMSRTEAARELACSHGYVCRLHGQIKARIARFAA